MSCGEAFEHTLHLQQALYPLQDPSPIVPVLDSHEPVPGIPPVSPTYVHYIMVKRKRKAVRRRVEGANFKDCALTSSIHRITTDRSLISSAGMPSPTTFCVNVSLVIHASFKSPTGLLSNICWVIFTTRGPFARLEANISNGLEAITTTFSPKACLFIYCACVWQVERQWKCTSMRGKIFSHGEKCLYSSTNTKDNSWITTYLSIQYKPQLLGTHCRPQFHSNLRM